MQQNFFSSYLQSPQEKEAIYALKGKYDNLTVFPLEDFGEDVYALTIGEHRGSTILCGGFQGYEDLTAPLLLQFAQELLSALALSGAICRISPGKLVQERSITIIPTLYAAQKTTQEQMALVTDLCKEWDSKRLYCFTQQIGKDVLRYPASENTPPHTHLMAQMLSSACGYPAVSSTPEQSPALHHFCDTTTRPVFEITTGRESLPLPARELEHFYEQMRELLMLTLVL